MIKPTHAPYPGWDVLKWDIPSCNDITRGVLARVLDDRPPRRFFTKNEWRVLEAVCDTVMLAGGG